MSGRKQHYIPQAVLRAFEAARTGAKSQVLVLRKARDPYLVSTEGVGAERDFYSNPSTDGKGSLDDLITEFEADHLAPILQALRSTREEVDGEIASVAVAHLAARTAHLRESMSMMTEDALANLKSVMADSNALRRFAGLDSLEHESRMAEMVRNELAKLVPKWTEKDRKALERLAAFRLRERFDDVIAEAEPYMRAGLGMFESKLADAVPRAHAQALLKSLVPQNRVDDLRLLHWRVLTADETDCHFILPDCVVVASTAADKELKPFAMLSSSEANVVAMPLSSRQLLVGSHRFTPIALAELNLELARSSLEFFVSSKLDEPTKKLAAEIGTCAKDLKVDWLGEDSEDSNTDPVPPPGKTATLVIRTPMGKSGDAIRMQLAEIAQETAEPATIERIESIIVPANLSAALEALWKRQPTADDLQACSFGTVEAVKQGSDWKCRIILPRTLAEMLISPPNSVQRITAIRLAKFNLGRAYYFDCWARQAPQALETISADPWIRLALPAMFRIASAYFGGQASARHESEAHLQHEAVQHVTVALRGGLTGLREARQRFFDHRNVDQLIFEAVRVIVTFLTPTAEICGFLEAKNTGIGRDSSAGLVLREAGLWEWLLLFGKDLRRHYDTRHRWASEADLHQLAGHLERLLWTIGVFVSPVEGGHWIDVLDDTRLEQVGNALRT